VAAPPAILPKKAEASKSWRVSWGRRFRLPVAQAEYLALFIGRPAYR
jgi:hypothetical protein